MRSRRPKPVRWLLVVLPLFLAVPLNGAHAQFGSAADTAQVGSSPQAPSRSFSPAPPIEEERPSHTGSSLNPYRSLEKYVEPSPAPSLSRSAPVGPSLRGTDLNRREKLLWGSVGLVVSSFCDTDSDTYTARPYPLLNAYERSCYECERMTRRAVDAVATGLFSPTP